MVIKSDGSTWICRPCLDAGSNWLVCGHDQSQLTRAERFYPSHFFKKHLDKTPLYLDAEAHNLGLRLCSPDASIKASLPVAPAYSPVSPKVQPVFPNAGNSSQSTHSDSSLPGDSGPTRRDSTRPDPVKSREQSTESESAPRSFQALDDEPIDHPFTSTRGHFADTAHLPLIPLEDPHLSEPRSKHLLSDYDINSGSVISPVFLIALPFGSVIETANIYPDERCEVCNSGMGCDFQGAEAGTQCYKPHARPM